MTKKGMRDLRDAMNLALLEGYPYIAVEIHMEGFPTNEIIINRKDNIAAKLKYYEDTYNDDLIHKYSPTISIVDFDYADYVDELKWFREDV